MCSERAPWEMTATVAHLALPQEMLGKDTEKSFTCLVCTSYSIIMVRYFVARKERRKNKGGGGGGGRETDGQKGRQAERGSDGQTGSYLCLTSSLLVSWPKSDKANERASERTKQKDRQTDRQTDRFS